MITKCPRGENWTMVSFTFDLKKFGMECLEDDTVALLKRRVIDLAGCLGKGVKVELDGKRVPAKTFEDYVKLYHPTSIRIYEKIDNRWEVCVCLADGIFEQVSFVNNIATMNGGSHVDAITSQITRHLALLVYFKPNDIKSYLSVFVNAIIDDPAFDSQTKEKLTTPKGSFGSMCELTPYFLNEIAKLGVVGRLLSSADFNLNEEPKKTDGERKKIRYIPELEDANLADTANSGNCTLILTQEISAKALAMSGLSAVGRDCYGVYPLTGKLLNVKKASPLKNAEFQNIAEILGLNLHGPIDKVDNLRYGHLMIMVDQDHYGSNIIGLLINFFHSFWPSLLKVPNFLRVFVKPIYKASNKKTKKVKLFYTIAEYEAWKKKLGDKATKYQIKHYKGLASIPTAEGKVYFSDLDRHTKDFVWADDKDGDAIDLAFSNKKIKEREDWLRAFKPSTILDLKEKHIRYRDFIHLDFRQYLVANLQRSIPSMVDGLKPDQRNILFCAFKEPIIQELNVAQFSDYVSLLSPFDHGEASLVGTIVGMAQNYVGSNNINLLQPKGQFGTRQMGGKDHGRGRYLFTQLSPITRCLFHEDELLLKYLKDGGRSIEAAWFIPIIPMVLVNGSKGLGTECSSFIPNYNPQDIICNLKRLLNGETMVAMQPWYKWFNGNIERTALEEYTTTGIYKVIKDENALSITELPVRRWTRDYKEFLKAASQDGKDKKVSYKEFPEVYVKDKAPFIKAYTAHYDDETVHFKIFMTQDQMNTAEEEGFLKKFKLTTTLSTANMHLFDANGVIKKYDTPEQILQEFFDLRLSFYKERKLSFASLRKPYLTALDHKLK
ncbi:DNA topoisomerase 2, partial [Tanacetum coccineum]